MEHRSTPTTPCTVEPDSNADDERRTAVPRGRRREDLWLISDKKVRDFVLWLVGVAGVINELFIVPDPRPSALIFLGSLIGVPFVLGADEKRRKDDLSDE